MATQLRSEIADTASSLHTLISAKVSTDNAYRFIFHKTNSLISFNALTLISDTLRLTDADKVIEMNVGTANNLLYQPTRRMPFPLERNRYSNRWCRANNFSSRKRCYRSFGKFWRKLSGQYSGATL